MGEKKEILKLINRREVVSQCFQVTALHSKSNRENLGTPDKPKEDTANPTVPSLLHKLLAFGVWFLPVYLSIYIFVFIIISVSITFYYCQNNASSL